MKPSKVTSVPLFSWSSWAKSLWESLEQMASNVQGTVVNLIVLFSFDLYHLLCLIDGEVTYVVSMLARWAWQVLVGRGGGSASQTCSSCVPALCSNRWQLPLMRCSTLVSTDLQGVDKPCLTLFWKHEACM